MNNKEEAARNHLLEKLANEPNSGGALQWAEALKAFEEALLHKANANKP